MPAMIRTYPSRTLVDLEHPSPGAIHVEDIAHALSMQCRYAGHCQSFDSVAEHSLLVCELGRSSTVLPVEHLAHLLHDAAEAYLGDVTSPLKSLLPHYRELEARWETVIRERFGLPGDDALWRRVARADHEALLLEQSVLCWGASLPSPSLGRDMECWSPADAERRFLHNFRRLGGR